MKITEKKIKDYQKYWELSNYLSAKSKNELYLLSNKFIDKLKDNDWETKGITFIYPQDCPDFDALCELANATHGYVITNNEGVKLTWDN